MAFAGLWTCADREGRFRWKPRELKLDCLPHDELDFSRVLDALVTRGFIVKYASAGVDYGCIPSWSEHQVINNRESESKIPPPPAEALQLKHIPTRASRDDDASPTRHDPAQAEGKGREGERKGREVNALPLSKVETAPSVPEPPRAEIPGKPPEPLTLREARISVSPAAATLASVCVANGVRAAPVNPMLAEWSGRGVTVDQLKAAIAKARERKPAPEKIPLAYLDPILREKPSNGYGNAWKHDEKACEEVARKLGMWPAKSGESWNELRQRIGTKLRDIAAESVH